MHVVDLDFVFDSQQTLKCIEMEAKIQDLTPLDDFDQPLPPLFVLVLVLSALTHMAYD
jgi:hypothetical protein